MVFSNPVSQIPTGTYEAKTGPLLDTADPFACRLVIWDLKAVLCSLNSGQDERGDEIEVSMGRALRQSRDFGLRHTTHQLPLEDHLDNLDGMCKNFVYARRVVLVSTCFVRRWRGVYLSNDNVINSSS